MVVRSTSAMTTLAILGVPTGPRITTKKRENRMIDRDGRIILLVCVLMVLGVFVIAIAMRAVELYLL